MGPKPRDVKNVPKAEPEEQPEIPELEPEAVPEQPRRSAFTRVFPGTLRDTPPIPIRPVEEQEVQSAEQPRPFFRHMGINFETDQGFPLNMSPPIRPATTDQLNPNNPLYPTAMRQLQNRMRLMNPRYAPRPPLQPRPQPIWQQPFRPRPQLPQPRPQPPAISLQLNINGIPHPIALPFNDLNLQLDPGNIPSTSALPTREEEIERVLENQNYQLHSTLERMHQRHSESLVAAVKKRDAMKLRSIDMEISQLVRRRIQLEEEMERMKLEAEQSLDVDSILNQCDYLESQCQAAVEEEEDDDDDKMKCIACGNKFGKMMVWQCNHMCLCKSCDEITRICPMCQSIKISSEEVDLE